MPFIPPNRWATTATRKQIETPAFQGRMNHYYGNPPSIFTCRDGVNGHRSLPEHVRDPKDRGLLHRPEPTRHDKEGGWKEPLFERGGTVKWVTISPTVGTQQVAPQTPSQVIGPNCESDRDACLRGCAAIQSFRPG